MAESIKEASYPLAAIAARVGGELRGDGTVSIRGVCSNNESGEDLISFLRERDPQRLKRAVEASQVRSLLVQRDAAQPLRRTSHNLVLVEDPLLSLIEVIKLFFAAPSAEPGIHPTATIHPSAHIDPSAAIGPYCCIGAGSVIAAQAVLHPHVVIYPRVRIGARTTIHSGAAVREDVTIGSDCVVQNGAIIGADGFGYVADPGLGLRAVPQVGEVVLEERVEVGANSCIDRATLGRTLAGRGTKIDNLVQVGHNVQLGKNVILCGQAGVAGSAVLGDGVVIGGNAGVGDHVHIAPGVRLAGKAGAIGDLSESGDYAGFPAVPAARWRREQAAIRRLREVVLPQFATKKGAAVKQRRTKESKS